MFEGIENYFSNLSKNVGQGSVQQAQAAIDDFLARIDPLLHNVFDRIGGICHGLLDRFDIDIKIKLNPIEKGQPPIEPDKPV